MYVNKTHLQGPHVCLHLLELFRELPPLPAMSIFYDPNLGVILLLMKGKMSHIKSLKYIDSVTDWPRNFPVEKGKDNFRHFNL